MFVVSDNILCISVFAFLLTSCERDDVSDATSIIVDAPVTYHYPPPEGKLPFPHHAPDFSKLDYESMMNHLFITNGFGNYQGDGGVEGMYMHTGLDIVLANGTPVYFINNGTVRHINTKAVNNKSIVVEDESNPGYAWTYIHIDNFNLTVGQKVYKGQFLGKVKFSGIEHIHLGRIKKIAELDWSDGEQAFYPDAYFAFDDFEAPDIAEGFYFLVNQSDTIFSINNQHSLSGEIDIVVGMRDLSQHGRNITIPTLAARILPSVISYRITNSDNQPVVERNFHLKNLIINHIFSDQINNTQQARLLLKPPQLFRAGPWYEHGYNYVIITHLPDTEAESPLPLGEYSDSVSWNTAEIDHSGQARMALT